MKTFLPPSFEAEAAYAIQWKPDGQFVGLDFGCGDRKSSPYMIGIDHHEGQWLTVAGEPHNATPDVVADLRNLPYPDESVDFITSIHSLEHFADPVALLTEWKRVLKIGGRIVIIVPDWRHTFTCENDDQKADPEAHKMDYTLPVLVDVLNRVPGFEILQASIVCNQWPIGAVVEKTK